MPAKKTSNVQRTRKVALITIISGIIVGFIGVKSVLAAVPAVEMTSVVVNSPTQVTVTCQTAPNANSGSVFGYYGPGATYGTKIEEQAFSASQSAVTTTHTESGLTPGDEYSFRCRVKIGTSGYNSNGQTLTMPMQTNSPGLTVTETDGSTAVTEPGTTDTIQIALASKPQSDVVLNVTSSDTTEATVAPAPLTFTAANWNAPQTVTVAAADDEQVDGLQAFLVNISVDAAVSSDEYDSVTAAVIHGTTTDNDTGAETPLTITAVGDICKKPGTSNVQGPKTCQNTARQVAAINPGYHIALGDLQYSNGTLAEFNSVYDTVWGPVKNITLPVVGNHEQKDTASTIGYCSYFDPANKPTGFCNDGMSYMRVLNSNWAFISMESTGTLTSAQSNQLNSFITAAGTRNIVLGIHEPPFSTKCAGCHGDSPQTIAYWQIAYDRGVDVVLTGHDHKYERFTTLSRTGTPVATGQNGLVDILVGTGANINDPGCDTSRTARTAFCAGSGNVSDPALRVDDKITNGGVIALKLYAGSFTWEYREADNSATNPTVSVGRLVDSGTGVLR